MNERLKISGYTVKIGHYHIEVVTYNGITQSIAIYKDHNRKLVKRFEW